MQKMEKLNFLTAGMPLRTGNKGYPRAFEVLEEMDLDGMEVEFVHGVRMSTETREFVNKTKTEKSKVLSCHAPFYVNLNAREPEKVDASVVRIVETAQAAKDIDAYSITYHAAFYLGNDKDIVFKKVAGETERILDATRKEDIKVWIRPETTGKGTQWGDLDEIIQLSKMYDEVLPCVDFSHIHARSGGGFNTYDDFCNIFEKIGNEIGQYALDNFHAHIAGIEYSAKGEKKHLNLPESDMNYKDLLKAFKKFDVKGIVVCESPNIEDDAKLLKEYYLSL